MLGQPSQPALQPQLDSNATSTEVDNLLRPRLIVIDGLDECHGQDIQVELLQILASAIPCFPIPLRILVASRPEGHITRTFDYDEALQSLNIRRMSLGDDENAASGIQRFLIRGFQEIHRTHPLRSLLSPSWPSQQTVDILVQKSSSHFIFASTAMKYIQYPRGKPDNRLEVILGLSIPSTTDKPFGPLDALYTHIFMSMEEPDRLTVNRVLGIMHIASQVGNYHIKTSPVDLEEYLGMQAGEINLLLEPLFSLLVLLEDRTAKIKVLHASLFDFLLDISRSGDLHLDLEMAHGSIAKYWLTVLLSYTLDAIMEGSLFSQVSVLDSCWFFLSHCNDSHLSDNMREYLLSFPFLYDIILQQKFLMKYLVDSQDQLLHSGIIGLLHLFFKLLLGKDFNNSQNLHTIHALRVEQQLQVILGGLHPYSSLLNDTAQEPLFNNSLYQNMHRVYKAYLDLCQALIGTEALLMILQNMEFWTVTQGGAQDLRAHCLIVSLSHLRVEALGFCTRYALHGYYSRGDKELRLVLEQRLIGYLQRVERDADPSDLRKCKEAWGITV